METLELAHRLQPETRRVVVVTGSSPVDRVWMAGARKQLGAGGPTELSYLIDFSFEDLLAEVRGLPRHTVVLAGVFFRDAKGRDLSTPEAMRQIAAASSVPVSTTPAAGWWWTSWACHGSSSISGSGRRTSSRTTSPDGRTGPEVSFKF